MNLSNLKIAVRLAAGFGLVLFLTLIVGAVALLQLASVASRTEQIAANNVPSIEGAAALQGYLSEIRLNQARSLLTDNVAEKDKFEKVAADTQKKLETLEAKVEPVFSSEYELKTYASFKQHALKWADLNKAMLENSKFGLTAQAHDIFDGDGGTQYHAALADAQGLADYNAQSTAQSWTDAQVTIQRARFILFACIGLAVVLGAGLAYAISRSIALPLARASVAARGMATGDMTVKVESTGSDEVGELLASLESMRLALSRVVSDVRQGSESVATASAEIAQGNNDLSNRTESQASALEETTSSMHELNSAVNQNADSARQANELAMTASRVATNGGTVVGQVVETMKGINEASRKISDIISVIDGIAFQTNILALNAAVEAARAGEQGRGFAVVASEVRSLAGRSAEAAKEIKMLINASVERVEQGSTLVDEAGSTMAEVVSAIKRVSDIVGEISAASGAQAAGVAHVGESVGLMDQSTQQNAALVEQMAAAASSLKNQAQELVQSVSLFKLNEADAGLPKIQVRSATSGSKPHKGPERRAGVAQLRT